VSSPRVRVANRIRRLVNRSGFDVVRDGFRYRFVFALQQHGVENVLDIGANVGQFGRDLRRAKFAGRIVSVEPLRAAYRRLEGELAADPAWTAECVAVSDRPGRVTLNVAGNSVSSSVLPMRSEHVDAAPAARYVNTEDVSATTVDDLVARHTLDPASTLLKIDVQGYEKAVLDGAEQTLPRFAAVRTEMSLVPLYDGQVMMLEMMAYLDERGFDLWFLERGFTDPHTRRVLQLDGVFFRRPIETLPADRSLGPT
jgi:FkbM family methyltransferase